MAVRRRSRNAATDVFAGFQDVSEIGAGSLATVYRARETDTGRAVALKLLNVRDVSARALESFQRESMALGAVSAHPNIVTLYRTFQTGDARPVLVLELCAGSIFDELRIPGGLSAQRVVAVGVKMAAALETAHRAEILHRDVKPQNILITEFGGPALADFGVAMLQASSQTTSGLFDFTTLHVAPELLEGRLASPATDVYELASTLYQLLAGQSAFRAYEGESPASVILRILRDPVRPLVGEGVPAALSDLLVSSMSKDQDLRPASAAEFALGLDRVERSQGWPATTFLVRDYAARSVSGPGAIAVPSPFAAAGAPAWTATSDPAPAGSRAGADLNVRPIERGPRVAVPVGTPAGRVAARSVEPVEAIRAPADPGGSQPGGGLSQLCANGHLVSAAVRRCPICESVDLASATPQPQPVRARHAAIQAERTEPSAPDVTAARRLDPDATISRIRLPPTAAVSRPDHDPWNPDATATRPRSLAERTSAMEPPPSPPQPIWGAAPPDPESTATHRGPVAFPIPPNRDGRGDPAADPDRTAGRPEQDLAALPIEWGALRVSEAAGTSPTGARSGRGERSERLVLRGRPMSAPGSRGWSFAVLGVAALVVVAAAAATFAAGLEWPVVVASVIGSAAIAGLLAAWIAMPTVIVDGSGVRTRGQRPAGRFAWADVVHFEPRYIDSGHAILVLHTVKAAVPLAATAADPVEVAKLASRLEEHRVRARDLARS